MPVLWREAMSVGNKNIDDEHKYLICLINSVEIALKVEDHHSMVKFLFSQLEEYTRRHFHNEEIIQLKIQYPKHMEHKSEHRRILEDLAELQRKFFDSEFEPEVRSNAASLATEGSPEAQDNDAIDPSIPEQASAAKADDIKVEPSSDHPADPSPKLDHEVLDHELVLLLRSWIMDHVLNADMQMKKYLQAKPKH